MQQGTCPICGADAPRPYRVGSTPVLRCSSCSVVFTLPSATEAELYYETDYSLTATTRISTELHRYFRYPEYQELVGMISQSVPTSASVLDIGCDHGFFLDDLRRYGFTVAGVELSERGRHYAQSIGLDVRKTLHELNDRYNAVTLWHVLEHISQPLLMLADIQRILEPGGRLFVRVPDFGSIPSKLLRDKWIWFQPHHHALHYTAATLRTVLQMAGFKVLQIEQRKPNTRLTKKAYRLAVSTLNQAHNLPVPNLRARAARMYQDITGVELLAIAELESKE